MTYNKESGYGKYLPLRISGGNIASGKLFVIGKAGLAYRDMYNQVFTPDADGRVRFVATIAAAVALCTANGGDQLAVMPGHTETISSATALTMSVAGVTVYSLGQGNDRCAITLDTATTATINVTAANVKFRNVIFIANFAAIVAAFTTTTAKDFVLEGCEFRDTSAVLNFVSIVTTATTSNAADGLSLVNCKRVGLGADTNTTIISALGTNDRVMITGGFYTHAATTDGGLIIIATGKILTNLEINNPKCSFVGSASSTGGILITTNGSTNTGYIDGCRIWSLDATTEILVTASSGFKFGLNYYSGTADKSGYLLPAADA